MKHNLKNRPRKLVTKHSSIVYLSNQKAGAVEEWFDGFEKELRERLEQQIIWTKWGEARALFIKEVLGEVEEAKP